MLLSSFAEFFDRWFRDIYSFIKIGNTFNFIFFFTLSCFNTQKYHNLTVLTPSVAKTTESVNIYVHKEENLIYKDNVFMK